jgi:hemerythrin-like domain-containing protein
MKVILKELRETFICLKIIHRAKLFKTESKITEAKKENNELISFFEKSIEPGLCDRIRSESRKAKEDGRSRKILERKRSHHYDEYQNRASARVRGHFGS